MIVTLDDKVIESKLLEKEKATEKYEDAIASGNSAFLMKEDKNKLIELVVGNINPGQKVKV